ncbi:MAG: phosphatase PAP2 family protein [Candidatus Nomurabacteria bacterium]|nr:phosphatase PAP2 family protein [Candidatus Nomurabacteria bacterium]
MNNQIFFFLYNFAHQSNTLDKLIIFTAQNFPYLVIVLAMVFLIFHHDALPNKNVLKELRIYLNKWKEIGLVFFSGILAWCLASLLKILFHTPRPFDAFTNVHSLISESGFAFPSGHATFYSALAVSLFFCHKRVGYVFMFFAFLIGIARIMVGVHFPIDILGGFVLGSIIAVLMNRIIKIK